MKNEIVCEAAADKRWWSHIVL